jgi:hypothetical protein
MAKDTKTSRVIALMTANKDKPMFEVCAIIERDLPCKPGYGKTWYRWCVKEGVAPGALVAVAKAPIAVGAPRERTVKRLATPELAEKVKAPKAPKADKPIKTAEEVAAIKEANLKRMREVAAKLKTRRVVDTTKEDDEKAKKEFRMDDDHPTFLTRDEVKGLGVDI